MPRDTSDKMVIARSRSAENVGLFTVRLEPIRLACVRGRLWLFAPQTARVKKAVSRLERTRVLKLASRSRMEQMHSSHERLNLKTHRAPTSVWERRGWDGSRDRLA